MGFKRDVSVIIILFLLGIMVLQAEFRTEVILVGDSAEELLPTSHLEPENKNILSPYVEDYLPYIPKRESLRSPRFPTGGMLTRLFPPAFDGQCAKGDELWKVCDPMPCSKAFMSQTNSSASTVRLPLVPERNGKGENSGVFINRILQRAWGPDPPVIDLYVRAGCQGAQEIAYLLKSVEYFWPRFLGRIILVLDFPDFEFEHELVPSRLKHHEYLVVYEHCPCMLGKYFNQYSYSNLFRYTDADYVVTIDSDCAFHSPITPDLLFSDQHLLLVPTSTVFQSANWNYPWGKGQFYFTNVSDLETGHPMMNQPLNFHVNTLKRFLLEWIPLQSVNHTCYEKRLVDFIRHPIGWHCWMCQVTPLIAHFKEPGYLFKITPGSLKEVDPFVRIAVHVNYEGKQRKDNFWEDTVSEAMLQGLCFWLGKYFPECAMVGEEVPYLKRLFFSYGSYPLYSKVPTHIKEDKLNRLKFRLEKAAHLAERKKNKNREN